MKINDAYRILVLDPIHGAEVLARELRELGKEVDIFNPYRESSFRGDLDHDLVISPVHLNPNFEIVKQATDAHIPIITHHEAVKELVRMSNLFDGVRVVEVTGTVKKTTVCELMSQMLGFRGRKLLIHTSSGTRYRSAEGEEQKLPRLSGSGTPANVIRAMRMAGDKGLEPDIAIFEVSLGLTGSGDVGVITSLEEDYKIAGGTKAASAAKIASIRNCDGILVHPGIHFYPHHPPAPGGEDKHNTYGDRGENLRIEVGGENMMRAVFEGLKTIDGRIIRGELNFALDWRMGNDYYRNCLEAALCALLSLGIAPEELNTGDITPVGGRMEIRELKGRILIDNSNSGTKLKFLNAVVDTARRLSRSEGEGQGMILIIGEDSPYVCEGVDEEELREVVKNGCESGSRSGSKSDFKEIIIVGERFRAGIEGFSSSDVRVSLATDLDTALNKAIEDSREGEVIISNVKIWR